MSGLIPRLTSLFKKKLIILCCVIITQKSVNSIVRDDVFLMDNNCYMLVTCHMSDVQIAGRGATFQCMRVSKFLYISCAICSLKTSYPTCVGSLTLWMFLVCTWTSSWQSHHFRFLSVILSHDSNLLIAGLGTSPFGCFATLQAQLNLHQLIQFCRNVSRYNRMLSTRSAVHHIIICTYATKI